MKKIFDKYNVIRNRVMITLDSPDEIFDEESYKKFMSSFKRRSVRPNVNIKISYLNSIQDLENFYKSNHFEYIIKMLLDDGIEDVDVFIDSKKLAKELEKNKRLGRKIAMNDGFFLLSTNQIEEDNFTTLFVGDKNLQEELSKNISFLDKISNKYDRKFSIMYGNLLDKQMENTNYIIGTIYSNTINIPYDLIESMLSSLPQKPDKFLTFFNLFSCYDFEKNEDLKKMFNSFKTSINKILSKNKEFKLLDYGVRFNSIKFEIMDIKNFDVQFFDIKNYKEGDWINYNSIEARSYETIGERGKFNEKIFKIPLAFFTSLPDKENFRLNFYLSYDNFDNIKNIWSVIDSLIGLPYVQEINFNKEKKYTIKIKYGNIIYISEDRNVKKDFLFIFNKILNKLKNGNQASLEISNKSNEYVSSKETGLIIVRNIDTDTLIITKTPDFNKNIFFKNFNLFLIPNLKKENFKYVLNIC